MLHQLVFALAAVLTALDLAPVHLSIGLMLLHVTIEIRFASKVPTTLRADRTGLDWTSVVESVERLINGMRGSQCSSSPGQVRLIVVETTEVERIGALATVSLIYGVKRGRMHSSRGVAMTIGANAIEIERVEPPASRLKELVGDWVSRAIRVRVLSSRKFTCSSRIAGSSKVTSSSVSMIAIRVLCAMELPSATREPDWWRIPGCWTVASGGCAPWANSSMPRPAPTISERLKKKTYPPPTGTASCRYARCDQLRSRLAES